MFHPNLNVLPVWVIFPYLFELRSQIGLYPGIEDFSPESGGPYEVVLGFVDAARPLVESHAAYGSRRFGTVLSPRVDTRGVPAGLKVMNNGHSCPSHSFFTSPQKLEWKHATVGIPGDRNAPRRFWWTVPDSNR